MARPNRGRLDALMDAYARMTAEERAAARYVMQGYDRAMRDRTAPKTDEPKAGEQGVLEELGERMAEDATQ